MAVVHVGGIPRSSDGGETWHPTLPIELDAHEVAAHRSRPNIVAAAAAVGLCLSEDHGRNWRIVGHHSGTLTSLAIAILGDEVLYSVQDGPFASETVIWRYSLTTGICEQVRQGLPERLGGKIDTGHIAAGEQQAAVVDGSGNIWISSSGSTGWRQVEGDVGDASCILMI